MRFAYCALCSLMNGGAACSVLILRSGLLAASRRMRHKRLLSSFETPRKRAAPQDEDRKSYAARIVVMNRSSSWRSRVLSVDSVCAEFSTSPEADPVSVAPRFT